MKPTIRRSVLALVMAFLLLSVSPLVATDTSDALKRVESYRADARQLVHEQGLMGWNSWVEGKPSDQDSLYRKYAHLFTPEAIFDTTLAHANAVSEKDKKPLRFFKLYQEAEYIGRQTAMLDDIYADLEASLFVNVDGKGVPYRELGRLLSQEADKARREMLAEEEYRVYGILNSVVLVRQLSMSHRLATELGYDSYAELASSYRMIDAPKLAALCKQFLADTSDIYLTLFDRVSPVPREKFRRSDTLFLLGGRKYNSYFPKENLLPKMNELMAGLGFDLNEQKNLLVDDRDLPTKVPRAVCFAIDVPGDVRLSIKPVGGKEDYSSLFHEMGHGQHFAGSETDIWEYQQLGANAVTETYAYLFEFLTENPDWIADNTNMDSATLKQYREFCVFVRLYMARRYMAKFLYELQLHQGVEDPQVVYQTLMSEAYGYLLNQQESTRYLSDVDPFLYSADYVQAFFLEAMLSNRLEERFGDKWWMNPGAGRFLKNFFARGNELTGLELANYLGYDQLEPSILTGRLERLLNDGAAKTSAR